MSFKIKDTILYKEDPDKNGVVFSVEDKSDNFLKVSGVAKEFIKRMLDGASFEEARKHILEEYDVEETLLNRDLEILKTNLEKIEFLA